jgi:hypothetical protein
MGCRQCGLGEACRGELQDEGPEPLGTSEPSTQHGFREYEAFGARPASSNHICCVELPETPRRSTVWPFLLAGEPSALCGAAGRPAEVANDICVHRIALGGGGRRATSNPQTGPLL